MDDIYGRAGGYLSTSDAAKALGVSRGTILQFIYERILPATNVGDGNKRPRYGISLTDINEFKKKYSKHKVRDPKAKKPGRKKVVNKEKELEKELLKKDKEIERLKRKMAKMAEDLFDMSVILEKLSKD